MSLNTIELPELLVTELYRNSLLSSGEASDPLPPRAQKPPNPSTTTPIPQPAQPPIRQSAEAPIVQPVSQPKASQQPSAATAPATAPIQPKAAAGAYKFLGNNGRKITIVVESPGIAYLPDDQLAFLSKMLEACKMNMGDVALVNQATLPVVIGDLKTQLQPAVLVLFGVEPVGIHLPINFPLFKIQPYDGCSYLYAPTLSQLVSPTEEGKLLKSKLWICLKNLFNV